MNQIDEQLVFDILSHPTRRKILRTMMQNYYVTYSELREVIGQSPGVIYHHLEKLQELGLLKQRSTKEYELTATGQNIVSYMDKIHTDDLNEVISRSSTQKIFLILPLGKFIQKNPLHWTIEVGLVFIIATLIQFEFPVQIIGPFLFPSMEPLLFRFALQILSYLIMISVVVTLAHLLTQWPISMSNQHLAVGLLILPLLSSLICGFLWGLSLITPVIPTVVYWVITIALQAGYTYLLMHLLLTVKKISFERSIIITLIQGYIFLLIVLFFG